MDDCINGLKRLTGSGHVLLTRRGNVSIRLSLKLAKNLGYRKVLLQDQGGWITYKQFCDKEKLEAVELLTDYGIVDPHALKQHPGCVLLINSMPAYSFLQDMGVIDDACKKENIFLINDVSGSIGTDEARYGDIMLGSFGIDKPVNLGSGGFIAAGKKEHLDFIEKINPEFEMDREKLCERLAELPLRLKRLDDLKNRLVKGLEASGFGRNIINKGAKGINILVRYGADIEKEKLINYCAKEDVEFTLCPRDIRIKERAVCIELKRR